MMTWQETIWAATQLERGGSLDFTVMAGERSAFIFGRGGFGYQHQNGCRSAFWPVRCKPPSYVPLRACYQAGTMHSIIHFGCSDAPNPVNNLGGFGYSIIHTTIGLRA